MDTEIFLVATPGLEAPLADEARHLGFAGVAQTSGGVTLRGGWHEIMRANLALRGATRVLVRIAEFRAMHPAQLDKRARKVNWGAWLRADLPVRVEAVCRKSRIYHAGAAQSRVERAISEELGARVSDGAGISVKVRIEDDLCTISLDTSGESLHKRGHKQAVGKAPMRETMAAMFLHGCGYRGEGPVYDPMSGSGTFVIEAAEIAAGLLPGRSRGFAFEKLAGFDASAFAAMQARAGRRQVPARFFGSDRDAGAVRMAEANTTRAGVADLCAFACHPAGDMVPPCPEPGLVIVNPPYGGRIGKPGPLFGLYAALGARLLAGFSGWRVGLVTSQDGLARATGLPWLQPGPIVAHGGLKVRLWRTGPI